MIAEIQSRMFRPQTVTVGLRQNVSGRTGAGVSKRMAKVVSLIICISLFVVFVFSQVMNWHIVKSSNRLEQLRSMHVDSTARNIELLAARARLASREMVEQRAAEKLQLFNPQRSQIRRL